MNTILGILVGLLLLAVLVFVIWAGYKDYKCNGEWGYVIIYAIIALMIIILGVFIFFNENNLQR